MGSYTSTLIQGECQDIECKQCSKFWCSSYRSAEKCTHYFLLCTGCYFWGYYVWGDDFDPVYHRYVKRTGAPIYPVRDCWSISSNEFLRLNEIHQLEDEDENMGTGDVELPSNKDLTLDNLMFQYRPGAPAVLKGIRLIIPEGKVTAIVGDSGRGKSTLLKLILRLYKPSYGQILIGGMNVNNLSLRQWRDRFGVVMQDGKIFNDTILNNIVLDEIQSTTSA